MRFDPLTGQFVDDAKAPQFNSVTGQYMDIDSSQARSVPPPQNPSPQQSTAINPMLDVSKKQVDPMEALYWKQMKEQEVIAKAMREKQEEALASQQGGISQMEQLAQQYRQLGPAIDFSPLAANYDAMYGTNMASHLKGETPQDRLSKLMEIQKGIQGAKDQFGDSRVKALKDQLALLNMKGQMQGQRQERFDSAQIEKADKEMRDQFGKLEGGANELSSTYNRLNNAFTPDQKGEVSAYEVKQAMSNFARSVGGEKGVLTDSDVARQLPADMQLALSSWENKIFSLGNDAKIPASNIAPLKSVLAKAQAVAADRYKQDLSRLKRNYETSPAPFTQKVWNSAGRIRYDDATKTIDKQFVPQSAPGANSAPPMADEFEAWKAKRK
jgi:hypothetical protein